MADDLDVLVVGGGLAGCTAALAASRAGAATSVGLVTAAESTLQDATGLIDVLGYTPEGAGPLVDPFGAMDDLPSTHPYSIVGEGAVRDGLALFDDVVGDRYCGGATDDNTLMPTYGGSVKPTARYPRSMAAGLASRMETTTLVGFERLTAYDAQFTADRLGSTDLPAPVTGMSISFPLTVTDPPVATRYASALEANEETDDGRPVRTALADAMLSVTGYQDRVGVPAVLGWESVTEIREALERSVQVPVFELPMGPPSVPGGRLESRFRAALADAGVDLRTGQRVTAVESGDGRVSGVRLDDGTEMVATEYVLATGGVAGSGIDSTSETVHEPLFGCHVENPPDRADWAAPDPLAYQPFARFGVTVDDGLRPLDADGDREYENLRAAGAVVSGYNFAAEKSGGGVSLATGTVAGRRAAE